MGIGWNWFSRETCFSAGALRIRRKILTVMMKASALRMTWMSFLCQGHNIRTMS